MPNPDNNYRSSRKKGWLFAILASGLAVVLIAAGVAYSTGDWSRQATHVGNDGAGLHIPPATSTPTQPPATNATPR